MSNIKSYGLKAHVSDEFDLHIGKRIKYVERGEYGKEHIYEVKAMYPFCILLEDIFDHTRICPCYSKLKLMLEGIG
nr:MAG TPA: hypothetical protein [Caudoviricetes sp.]